MIRDQGRNGFRGQAAENVEGVREGAASEFGDPGTATGWVQRVGVALHGSGGRAVADGLARDVQAGEAVERVVGVGVLDAVGVATPARLPLAS